MTQLKKFIFPQNCPQSRPEDGQNKEGQVDRAKRSQFPPKGGQIGQFPPQGGQVIVEYILLMVVLLGVFMSIMDVLKENGLATKFTQDPWEKLNGMIQCGNWTACGVEKSTAGVHPNTSNRVLTLDPKTVR